MDNVARSRLSPTFRMALLSGAFESVRMHLRSGEHVNVCDEKGRTPLILAATRGHDEVCRLLLQEGACLHICDQSGNDAASTALARGHKEVQQLILDWLHASSGDKLSTAAESKWQATSARIVGDDVLPVKIEHVDDSSLAASISNPDLPSSVAIAPNNTRFDETSDLDLSGWEEEVEAAMPHHDANISANSVTLHGLLTRHLIIDTDEGWDEVEIELPDPADFRLVRPH